MEALTVESVSVGDLVALFQRLENEKADTSAGALAAGDVCGPGARGYVAHVGAVPVLAYVLSFAQAGKKLVCWVLAAVGDAPGRDLTGEILPVIERQARQAGAQQIAITTKRRGLAKKINALGFIETGRTYRKNLA